MHLILLNFSASSSFPPSFPSFLWSSQNLNIRSCDSGSNGIHVDRNCALQCWSLIFHPQCCNLSIATIVACMLTCPNVAYCTYIFPLLLSTLMQINNKKTQTHKSLDFLVRTYSLFILFSHFLPVRYPDSCRQEKHS